MSQETSKPNESEEPMKNARAAMSGDAFAYNGLSSARQAGLSSIKTTEECVALPTLSFHTCGVNTNKTHNSLIPET